MFCEKCGNQLSDTVLFCTNCGNEVNKNTSNSMNNGSKIENNNEVLLEVRPTFKFTYIVLPKLIRPIITLIPCIVLITIFINAINNAMSITNETGSSVGMSMFMPIILMFLAIPVISLLITLGKAFFEKKQYENYKYTFYKDRVVFRDSFLNVSEKELKYKYIREITKRQTFIQRYFNIGNIVLFSNAESGYASGVFMLHIENVDDVYRQIKEITNV